MKRFLIRLLCCFIPHKKTRHIVRTFFKYHDKYLNLKIIVIDNGIERKPKLNEMRRISVSGTGKNNILKMEAPLANKLCLNIMFTNSDNNVIYVHKNVKGIYSIGCYDFNNNIEIGENCASSSIFISSIGHTVKIGRDCMLSNNIHIWGDGHSVLDLETGTVLNKPTGPIIIGNHCWIGERVTLTKNAQLPDDCIVGIASVVTKKFTEEHSVIAGSPAKVVKTGITWHGFSPLTYEDRIKSTKK